MPTTIAEVDANARAFADAITELEVGPLTVSITGRGALIHLRTSDDMHRLVDQLGGLGEFDEPIIGETSLLLTRSFGPFKVTVGGPVAVLCETTTEMVPRSVVKVLVPA